MTTNKAGNPVLNLHRDVDSFTRAYIECALWSTMDESTPSGGEPMDRNYDWTDLADETLARMVKDCGQFQWENRADLDECGLSVTRQGHDFWLNRNGHGSGFWGEDGDEAVLERLSEASHAFGVCDLYAGDDGKIYAM